MADALAPPAPAEHMTIREVSAWTGIPEGTLRYWRHEGDKGPRSAKFGRRIVYRRADVQAWVDEQFAEAVGDDLGTAS